MEYIHLLPLIISFVAFLFPPVIEGKSARHTFLYIEMPPVAKNGNIWYAVLVQERGEYRFSKLLGMIAGLPFVFVELSAPVVLVLLLQVIVIMVFDGFSRSFQQYDLAGHNAEWMTGVRDLSNYNYRAQEIERLTKDLDKIEYFNLKGKPQSEKEDIVDKGLKKWEWLGEILYVLGNFGGTNTEKNHS